MFLCTAEPSHSHVLEDELRSTRLNRAECVPFCTGAILKAFKEPVCPRTPQLLPEEEVHCGTRPDHRLLLWIEICPSFIQSHALCENGLRSSCGCCGERTSSALRSFTVHWRSKFRNSCHKGRHINNMKVTLYSGPKAQ